MLRRALSWPACVLTLAVAALPLWLLAAPWVTQRCLTGVLRVDNASPEWSIQWRRADRGSASGFWLNLPETLCELEDKEVLELRIPGRPRDPSGRLEVWFYFAVPLAPDQPPIDLQYELATAHPADVGGSWVPFIGGDGIVYYGPGPGWLRLEVPPGGIQLYFARLPVAGEVVVSYANETKTVDLVAPEHSTAIVSIHRRPHVEGAELRVSQLLPNYEIENLALCWKDSAGARFDARDVHVWEYVYGIPVRRRALTVQPDEIIGRLNDERYAYYTHTPAGAVQLGSRLRFGRTVHGVGYALTWLGLLAAMGAARCVRRIPWRRLPAALRPAAVGLALVVLVRLWMGWWAPLFVSFDGIQYFSQAQTLLDTGRFDHFDAFRMLGYSIFLAPFLALFHDFGPPLVLVQALMGAAVAWFTYDIARRALPAWWAAGAMIYVGLDPILLAYEKFALTECISTFLVTLLVWMLVRYHAYCRAHADGAWRSILLAVALGVLCGAAAYVRSNLLVFLVLAPAVVLGVQVARRGPVRGVLHAAVAGTVGACCVVPWIMRNYATFGYPVFAVGRYAQRACSFWDADALDLNQPAVWSLQQWKSLDSRGYFPHTELWALLFESRLEGGNAYDPFTNQEIKSRVLVEESLARRPLNVLHGMLVAFGNHTGLWNKLRQTSGRETVWWTRNLRGEEASRTNLLQGTTAGGRDAVAQRLHDIERDISYMHGSASALWFNDLYYAYELSRPVIGVLFVVGLLMLLRRASWPVAIAALIALANIGALSVLVGSAIDRYGVPFKPLLALTAAFALHALIVRRSSPPPAAGPVRRMSAPQLEFGRTPARDAEAGQPQHPLAPH